MTTIILASRNPGKLAEMQALFTPLGWKLRLLSDFTSVSVEETESTFAGNALLKARHAARISGLPAIADDSGLCLDALNGAPGVLSARFAGEKAADAANNEKLLRLLKDMPDEKRGAQFVCAMVFVRTPDDSSPVIAGAKWRGSILREPRGINGFGYDPLFFVPTHGCASAELRPEVKNQISHRGQAARALLAQLCEE